MPLKNVCPPKLPSCWRGFTLAELLITITILVIIGLAVLIGINPMAQIKRGYDTVRKDDLQKIKVAFESYYADHGYYPPGTILKNCGSTDLEPYLNIIPCDPTGNRISNFAASGSDGTSIAAGKSTIPYAVFTLPAGSQQPQKYVVFAKLSNTADPIGDLITSCPDTIAASSPSITNVEIIYACTNVRVCPIIYGCKEGACVAVAVDSQVTCSPSSCLPSCGAPNGTDTSTFCSQKNRRGIYINQCKPF